MTNEELDQARAEEARKQQYDIGAKNMLDVLAHAARLAREGWTPPVPVDPDLAEAEEMSADLLKGLGPYWRRPAVPHFLRAIKRGRKLAAAEAKPGLVWKKYEGSGECPGDPTDAVMVQYDGGTCSYKVMAHLIHDWQHVTHYAIITPPEDK